MEIFEEYQESLPVKKSNICSDLNRPECIAAAVQAARNLFNPLLQRTSSDLFLSKLLGNKQQWVRLRLQNMYRKVRGSGRGGANHRRRWLGKHKASFSGSFV